MTSGGGNVFGAGCPTNGADDTTSPANLGSLADNDGSTQSHFPGAGSAAINRTPFGTRSCGSTVTVDQRSVGRPKPAADSACDAGSVEISTNYPIANDDSFDVDINSDNTFDVLGNDVDPEGAPLQIKDVTTPSHGTITIEGNMLRYMPTAGYFGPDSVAYTADDNNGGTATADVSINVQGGGAIRGTVFNDLNGDGVRQADEPGLAGWGVVRVSSVVTPITPLTVSGNGLLSVDFTFSAQLRTAAASTANFGLSTGSDGSFEFAGQLPFPFYFYAHPPLGEESLWQQTLPGSGAPYFLDLSSLPISTTIEGVDFGFTQSEVGILTIGGGLNGGVSLNGSGDPITIDTLSRQPALFTSFVAVVAPPTPTAPEQIVIIQNESSADPLSARVESISYIGPAGGIFACEGGRVIVPALTLSAAIPFRCEPASATVTAIVSPGHTFVRMLADIGFEGRTEVAAPVTICLPHTIADVAAADGNRTNLRVGHLRGGYWEALPYVFGNRDETCGTTVHFSPFGLLAVQPGIETKLASEPVAAPDANGDQLLLWGAFLFLSAFAFALSLGRIRQIHQ